MDLYICISSTSEGVVGDIGSGILPFFIVLSLLEKDFFFALALMLNEGASAVAEWYTLYPVLVLATFTHVATCTTLIERHKRWEISCYTCRKHSPCILFSSVTAFSFSFFSKSSTC